MPVELDTAFLGLWLDEELLREEFHAIIEAGWSDEKPIDRRPLRPRPPLPHRTSPFPRRPVLGATGLPSGIAEPGRTPARERGPPVSAMAAGTRPHETAPELHPEVGLSSVTCRHDTDHPDNR